MNTNKMLVGISDNLNISVKFEFPKSRPVILKSSMYNFLIIIAACLLVVKPLGAQEGIKGNLVSVGWLEKNLKNPDVLILDASPSQVYSVKHIPGAINYDLFSYGVSEMPVAEIEKRYQSWGISSGKKIVMYDQGGNIMATRLFFSLYYYGLPAKDLFIVDGGLSMWQEKGFPVTSEVTPAAKKGSITIGKLKDDTKAELPEFLTASGDLHSNILLEALNPEWHFGGFSFFSKPGHIPNAIMLPTNDFYNLDKTFKSPEEISKMLTYLGISPEQQIYTYCGGGIAASVPYFVLKFLLGYPNVKLYVGSQLEWVSDQRELPTWTYDAPYLLRETQWLQFWGGKMARMYGISHVNILDVRSELEFNQEHVPFASNIPFDVFKNNITHPDKLTELLGTAGVNSSNEAVIISGSGLTKESALAFLMLEKLGQKKVSIFLDTHDKWVKFGSSLIKTASTEGQQKGSNTIPIPPVSYTVNLSKNVIITDPNSTKGIYPKVFIASGKNMPTNVPIGNVVHVPYTDLLNSDGTPKAAKDIWNIFAKAGVPRYAEIVCCSDDPSEAAVNYFILKLMGYPDIKVLSL